MKTRTLLIAAVMFLGLTAAAFAQATFTVGSIPVTAVVNTGQVELTGDITFSQVVNGNASVLGTITVTYPVPITVPAASTSFPNGIRIINPVNYGAATILSVSNGQSTGIGQVVIAVPAGVTSGSFTLTGVRVAVAGTTLTSLSASISSTNNAIIANQTSVVVISSIAAGIASIKTTTTGSLNAVTGAVIAQPVITVTEGFLNAWGDPNISTEAGVRITLSAAPPAGVTVTFPATATSNGVSPVANPVWQTVNSDGTALGTSVVFTSTSTSLTVFYRATSTTDPTKAETLTVNPTLAFTGTSANLPLPATTVTYLVSLAPIGTPFDTSVSPPAVIVAANLIPRYAASDVGPANLFTVTGLTSTLLVPFAQTVTAIGYNTGFAISNTTEDPGTAMGFGSGASPVPQSGTITFYFFPALPSPAATNPTNFSYTPTSTVGHGLDSNGKLISGGTYTVLLSELLAAAGQPADFIGYVFIVTNFTNAHCFWTISNFTTYTQGGYALVITGSRSTPTAESLNN